MFPWRTRYPLSWVPIKLAPKVLGTPGLVRAESSVPMAAVIIVLIIMIMMINLNNTNND